MDHRQSAFANAGTVTLESGRLLTFFIAFAWVCFDQTDTTTRSTVGIAIGFFMLFLLLVARFTNGGNLLTGWQASRALRHTPKRVMRRLARLKDDLNLWRSARSPTTAVR